MKTFKRFTTLMLAALMLFCSMTTPAFAAEPTANTDSELSLNLILPPK